MDLPLEVMGRFSLLSLAGDRKDIGPAIIEISLEDGADDDTSASLESDPMGLLLCCDSCFF